MYISWDWGFQNQAEISIFFKFYILINYVIHLFTQDHIEQMKHLHLQLQQPDYHEALRNFLSPLNNSNRLGDLR